MKKLMLIPALLLVAVLFITCDTGGDWYNPPFSPPEDVELLYFKSWQISGASMSLDAGNTKVQFSNPVDASGFDKIVIVIFGHDLDWWYGGNLSDDDGDSTDWEGGLSLTEEDGFGYLVFDLTDDDIAGVIDTLIIVEMVFGGGGPTATSGGGCAPKNVIAIWLE